MHLIDKNIPVHEPNAVSGPAPAELRANRYDVVSRLADDLAHEIKNPLNAIIVNLEVLRRRVENGAQEGAIERADVIEQEIRRVHGLVDQLLQLLRPDRGEVGPIAVDGVIAGLLNAVQVQAKAARVDFESRGETSLYAQVRIEPLKFALLNGLTYAIDAAAAEHGKVTLETRRASEEIYIVITCSEGALSDGHQHIEFCRRLMESAGGTLESLEPRTGGAGSTLTLVVPAARFG